MGRANARIVFVGGIAATLALVGFGRGHALVERPGRLGQQSLEIHRRDRERRPAV